MTLAAHNETRLIGCVTTLMLAAASTIYARRTGEAAFVVYAWVYGTIAVDILVLNKIHEDVLDVFYLLVSTIGAIAGLFVSHARLRRTA